MHVRVFQMVAYPSSVLRRFAVTSVCIVSLAIGVPPSRGEATEPTQSPHGHASGTHGGLIVPLGRDSHHVEPVFEKDGVVRLYMLAADETRVQDVERQTLKAYAKGVGGSASELFVLEPEPQEGDAADKTSRFRGTLPPGLRTGPVEVAIPMLRIAGERFRVGFISMPASHGEVAMPAKAPDDAARTLYLVPGGLYTAADIEANGLRTAAQAFAAFVPRHDLHPQVGDRICPITRTKANPACAWIIGGKSYQFCCPPCVDEFVKLAKEHPAEIQEPEAYVH